MDLLTSRMHYDVNRWCHLTSPKIVIKVNVNINQSSEMASKKHRLISFAQAQFCSDLMSQGVITSLLSCKFCSRCMVPQPPLLIPFLCKKNDPSSQKLALDHQNLLDNVQILSQAYHSKELWNAIAQAKGCLLEKKHVICCWSKWAHHYIYTPVHIIFKTKYLNFI